LSRLAHPKDARVLLIVTNRQDFAADFLITRLLELDLPYYRLDAEVMDSAVVSCHVGGSTREQRVSAGGRELDLRLVRSVWYRRILRPSRLDRIAPPFRAFAAAELQHLFEGMLGDSSYRWVNPIAATEAAERKLLQLRLAPECGLAVPPTIVSNDPGALAAFAEREQPVICKPISQGFLSTGTEHFAVHTHDVSASDFRQQTSDESFPTLLQHRVAKGHDIRMTVIGKDSFAVEIEAPTDAPVDWRAIPGGSVSYRRCTVPPQVETGCRLLMERLRLLYGAFDFIRTANGDWLFLEVNPAGEWAWLEVELGLPMRDAFVNLFYGA
jgi:glutathione synthase/RimK-type ligase-like ATP-grasp enzyme